MPPHKTSLGQSPSILWVSTAAPSEVLINSPSGSDRDGTISVVDAATGTAKSSSNAGTGIETLAFY